MCGAAPGARCRARRAADRPVASHLHLMVGASVGQLAAECAMSGERIRWIEMLAFGRVHKAVTVRIPVMEGA